jgi:hypothetical protein
MPYCPACQAEYAPGVERCHDCDVELVDSLEPTPAPQNEAPPGTLVTVAAFEGPLKASLLASRLETEGIQCFIADAEMVGMYQLLTSAVGGVKVQVSERDAPRAFYIARELDLETIDRFPARRPNCPQCGSSQVSRKGLSFGRAALVVLTLGVLALFFAVRWKCEGCGHSWR